MFGRPEEEILALQTSPATKKRRYKETRSTRIADQLDTVATQDHNCAIPAHVRRNLGQELPAERGILRFAHPSAAISLGRILPDTSLAIQTDLWKRSFSVCSGLSASGYSLDPSDLNVASIAIGDLLGVQTVTRKVTNVGLAAATYNASVSGMTGFTVAVTPSSLTISPGETKSYAVTITRTTAPINEYTGGQLTWTDGSHNVRIPMVVRPQ